MVIWFRVARRHICERISSQKDLRFRSQDVWIKLGRLTEKQFETLNILAEKSPGIRTTKCIFMICCYKNGFLAGLVAVLLFTLPSSILMYIIGRNT